VVLVFDVSHIDCCLEYIKLIDDTWQLWFLMESIQPSAKVILNVVNYDWWSFSLRILPLMHTLLYSQLSLCLILDVCDVFPSSRQT
jgi:LPS sulfotransferase NodH